MMMDQVVVPVAFTYEPLSTLTATFVTPLPPALSCEVPEIVRLPAGTFALLAGFEMVTVGAVVSAPALVVPDASSDRVPILPLLSTAATL